MLSSCWIGLRLTALPPIRARIDTNHYETKRPPEGNLDKCKRSDLRAGRGGGPPASTAFTAGWETRADWCSATVANRYALGPTFYSAGGAGIRCMPFPPPFLTV